MDLPNRHSIRLNGYDYTQNGYHFVTICTQNRECLFGEIKNVGEIKDVGAGSSRPKSEMVLNNLGEIVESVWQSLSQHYPVKLDKFQIMPNHFHGIIIIDHSGQKNTLGNIIAFFKYQSTKQINNIGREDPAPTEKITFQKIFQRNYYEHVIRNELELNKIREYIQINPTIWDRDRNNPNNLKSPTNLRPPLPSKHKIS